MKGDHSEEGSEFSAEEIARLLEERDGQLSDREAGVLRMRFGLVDGSRRTLFETGQVYGVSSERVRQIQVSTLAKLKQPWPSPRIPPRWLDEVDSVFEDDDLSAFREP